MPHRVMGVFLVLRGVGGQGVGEEGNFVSFGLPAHDGGPPVLSSPLCEWI